MNKEFFDVYNSYDLEKQTDIDIGELEIFHGKGWFMTSKRNIIDGTEVYS